MFLIGQCKLPAATMPMENGTFGLLQQKTVQSPCSVALYTQRSRLEDSSGCKDVRLTVTEIHDKS
jgi:hypothetical protein